MARIRGAKQLSLPFPKPSAAERKAMIKDRLFGYEFRQALRESKREAAARRRAAQKAGGLDEPQVALELGIRAADFEERQEGAKMDVIEAVEREPGPSGGRCRRLRHRLSLFQVRDHHIRLYAHQVYLLRANAEFTRRRPPKDRTPRNHEDGRRSGATLGSAASPPSSNAAKAARNC